MDHHAVAKVQTDVCGVALTAAEKDKVPLPEIAEGDAAALAELGTGVMAEFHACLGPGVESQAAAIEADRHGAPANATSRA